MTGVPDFGRLGGVAFSSFSAMSHFKTYLMVLLLTAVSAFVLTPFVIRLALRWGAVDHPSERKVHDSVMPRMGGLAVFGAFCVPWLGLYLIDNPVSAAFRDFETRFAGMLFAATAMLLLGIYDDIKGADAAKKFLFQVLAAVGLWMCGVRIDDVALPWGTTLTQDWINLPLTVFWIVGVTNAINLLDGIDGLVAGVTAVMALSLAIINVLSGNIMATLLALSLTGACVGFLPYNHSPARVFLGDTGSLTIGIVLAVIGIFSLFSGGRQIASPLICVPLILFGLPLVDTLRVMAKRIARGKSIFAADKSHVHHRLLELGMNHRQASCTLYIVATVLGGTAILLFRLEHGRQLIFSLIFAILSVGVYAIWRLLLRDHFMEDGDPAAPER